MIKVEFVCEKNKQTMGIKVKGHAGQAEKGQDIICASASAYLYNFAQYAKFAYEYHYLKRKPVIRLEEGDGEVLIIPKKEHYAEVRHILFYANIGYTLLAKNYPQFIELTDSVEQA